MTANAQGHSAEIVLVGAGNIGSRHLQSLANFDEPARITVIEPNEGAKALALERYQDVVQENSPAVFYHSNLNDLPNRADICILATPASGRLELLGEIISRMECKHYIFEKVVFQSEGDFVAAETMLSGQGAFAWVNCPRRQWQIFKNLKNDLGNSSRLECFFEGEKFALGCNAIHLIDVFQYLTDCSNVEVSGVSLSAPIEADKRGGYIEFSGILKVATQRGDVFEISSTMTGQPPSAVMTVKTDNLIWELNQLENKLEISSSETSWQKVVTNVNLPFQSQLTSKVVRDLLNCGNCDLVTLSGSHRAHAPLLHAFIDQIEKSTGLRPDFCNIT